MLGSRGGEGGARLTAAHLVRDVDGVDTLHQSLGVLGLGVSTDDDLGTTGQELRDPSTIGPQPPHPGTLQCQVQGGWTQTYQGFPIVPSPPYILKNGILLNIPQTSHQEATSDSLMGK